MAATPMATFSCENCGFTGEADPANGACPRCGFLAPAEPFRVPPLPPPSGRVATDIEPERHAPPGGYLELDLGEVAAQAPAGATAPPSAPRRNTPRTGPAFAAVAPAVVPSSPRSALPVFVAVGVGCLALIVGGVLFSRGGGDAAPSSAPPPDARPAPAPGAAAPPAAETSPTPRPTVLAAPAPPEVVAPARSERRTDSRADRGRRLAQAQAARAVRDRPARTEREAGRLEPPPAPPPAPATTPLPAAVAPAVPAPGPALPPPIEDAPRYPSEGFRRPQMAEPQCVQRSIRAPRDLADRVNGPVTIRFAVGPDGDVSLFQVMGEVPDPRLPGLLEGAVRSCAFTPGADAQGRSVRMWVTMPIRFTR